jgi:hypothetical protein
VQIMVIHTSIVSINSVFITFRIFDFVNKSKQI